MAQEEEDDQTPLAEQESLIRHMHSASKRANLAQHHAVEEEEEEREDMIKAKTNEMQEDDEFIQ